ncbi:hypothetical protein NP233_g1079 [Leucocoprinus birnbaumii]|uniref:Uncharacterized protein n=1 Tax=Leucocoprinus birnbaumii TaxID=56174 RepID=A0AAD5W1Q4_9AGAR|nr:hypothetical protein NP233_g1079 [Leucocoprinus birnbaumii]
MRSSVLDETFLIPLGVWVSAYLFETLLYGILVVLCVVAAVSLVKNKTSEHWRWLLAAGCIMLFLATADLILGYYILFTYSLHNQAVSFRLVYPKYFFYVTNNVIADCLVLHRCYMVWGRDRRVIALPVFALIATSGPEWRTNGIYVFMTFAFNSILTILMASRIWWISRQVAAVLGKELAKKYRYATAIIIESGAIYSIYVFLDLFLVKPQLDVGLTQIVAIVPTLIIVQVGLGRQARDFNDTMEMARSGSQPGSARACGTEIRFESRCDQTESVSV